jgi:quercetin dioxygenase-like cupin family protein
LNPESQEAGSCTLNQTQGDHHACNIRYDAGATRSPAVLYGRHCRSRLRFRDRQGAAGHDRRGFDGGCAACAVSDPSGSTLDTVEPVTSHALPNVPGKRVTIVRVFYGPGGFTRAHRHAGSVTAYVTKGEIRSQLGGGPVETFKVGQSFFEPPGATHLISANASNTEPAELIAVFVADEGAELTTFIE